MIYTPFTNQALRIAWDAHRGQVDKAGMPYVFHPLHLAEQFDDETRCCVALLHDVLEDSDYTDADLSAVFPYEVMISLRLLTRQKGVNYFDYIHALSENKVARDVKIADLKHNLDSRRFAGTGFTPSVSLETRYIQALEMLRIHRDHIQQERKGKENPDESHLQ